eukprot:3129202-Prymnesium_polylepis.1
MSVVVQTSPLGWGVTLRSVELLMAPRGCGGAAVSGERAPAGGAVRRARAVCRDGESGPSYGSV